jgi:nicotinate phosphoribosyltransferase
MAHSYVLSFPDEASAFRAFLEDFPDRAVLLVDTYDTPAGVRHAIAASRETGVELQGVRLDSGDLLRLSREARLLLDDAGMSDTRIVASGDLEERRIAELVEAGAPIDVWGVGTDLGTSRDAPALGGVYKLVAHESAEGWRGLAKHSPAKETVAGPKQVFRRIESGAMTGDVIAAADEELEGRPLLVPAMRSGEALLEEGLDRIRVRAEAELSALPAELRMPDPPPGAAYPVSYSPRLRETISSGES